VNPDPPLRYQLISKDARTLARLGRVTTDLPPEQRRILDECIDLARQCSAEIRTASYLLHPPLLDELGLASALRWLVDGFRERSGIDVTLDVPANFARLDSDSELALFRVAQESLTNVLRHAGQVPSQVRVTFDPGRVTIEVRNTPSGAAVSPAHTGHGLLGMRERVLECGGELTSGPDALGGFVVRAVLPAAPA
jgi:signal transduction histidine kinase